MEIAMQLNGLLHGARLLSHVDFPTSEVLGPDASEDQIQDLIDRHGLIFIKPVFRGGVGKKGKAGLIGKATDAEGGAGREGAALLLRAPARQRLRQGQRRHLRGAACRPSTRSTSRSPTTRASGRRR